MRTDPSRHLFFPGLPMPLHLQLFQDLSQGSQPWYVLHLSTYLITLLTSLCDMLARAIANIKLEMAKGA